MSRHIVDIKKCMGVGPIGRIVRVLYAYAGCKLRNEQLQFSTDTVTWWSSVFSSSYFYEAVEEAGENDQFGRFELIKEHYPNQEDRHRFLCDCAEEILNLDDSIVERYSKYAFDPYTCIYMRGTDKITEAPYYPPILAYEVYESCADRSLPIVGVSDSILCLDELQKTFKEQIIQRTDTIKSNGFAPLHLHTARCDLEITQEALLDVYTMANAELLIYSHSMMVNLASYLNRELKQITVESVVDKRLRRILKQTNTYMDLLYRSKASKC